MYAIDSLPISEPVRVTAPTFAQEPITLQEARRQCSLPESDGYHDQLLQSLIVAAREQVEQDTSLVCYTGSFTYKLTEWPDGDFFTIPLRPVTSITSIAYLDANGDSQVWASSNYTLKTGAVKQFVHLTHNAIFPVIRGDYYGITVTFVAGYATVAAIPQRIKQAILLLVGHWFLHRETVLTGTISKEIEFSYSALIGGLMRSSYP